MSKRTEFQKIEAADHHFVRLMSGQWLFRAPVGGIVLLLDNEEDKEKLLDKWTHYYVHNRPSRFTYLLMIYLPPLAILYAVLTGIRSMNQASPSSQFHSDFADELARFPRSSLAQFRFAQSGEVLGALKLKYVLSCCAALLCISLLLAGGASALPSQVLEMIGDHSMIFYLLTSICALFAGSSAWGLRGTLRELARADILDLSD